MSFTWPGGPAAIGPTLGAVVDRAEAAGIDSIWPRPPAVLDRRPVAP